MNTNLKKILLLSTVVFATIIMYVKKENPSKKPTTEIVQSSKIVKNNLIKNKQLIKEFEIPLVIQQADETILKFNQEIPDSLSLMGNSLRNEVGKFSVQLRNNTDDVINQVTEYEEDYSNSQIQIEELIRKCYKIKNNLKNLEKSINNPNSNLNDIFFNEYYFYKGIKDSGFCKRLGTKDDPFWMFLKLARNGDILARLQLLDYIRSATNRKLINVRKKPLEYMYLRDEAISFLQIIAAKGVHRASERLGRLFSGRDWDILDENPVLAYYYFYLAKSQDDFEPHPYELDLDSLYAQLSKKQKQVVDRMIEVPN